MGIKMVKLTFSVAVFSILFAANLVQAKEIATQEEANEYEAALSGAADNQLNATYRQIMKCFSENAEEKELAKKAQQAWLKYRDAQAESEAFEAKGGSAESALHSNSVASTTKARAKYLKDAYPFCFDK